MTDALAKFYAFLDRPLFPVSRLVLAALVIPLVMSFWSPLWRISMKARQYPDGLTLDVYAHKVEGGHGGKDIPEINTLNHYIGMKKIDRAAFNDLDWIPFALGLLVILTLRCAAIGNVRSLVDLAVVAGYISLFAFGRFVYRLWVFGHELDPAAPITVKPFMPAVFGSKQVANFTTTSYPQTGSILIGVFMTGLLAVLGWHLIAGRRAAARAERAAGATPAPVPAAQAVQVDDAGAGDGGKSGKGAKAAEASDGAEAAEASDGAEAAEAAEASDAGDAGDAEATPA